MTALAIGQLTFRNAAKTLQFVLTQEVLTLAWVLISIPVVYSENWKSCSKLVQKKLQNLPHSNIALFCCIHCTGVTCFEDAASFFFLFFHTLMEGLLKFCPGTCTVYAIAVSRSTIPLSLIVNKMADPLCQRDGWLGLIGLF